MVCEDSSMFDLYFMWISFGGQNCTCLLVILAFLSYCGYTTVNLEYTRLEERSIPAIDYLEGLQRFFNSLD